MFNKSFRLCPSLTLFIKAILVTSRQADLKEYSYLGKLSRGGLVQPATYLLRYVSKSSAILNCIFNVISSSP